MVEGQKRHDLKDAKCVPPQRRGELHDLANPKRVVTHVALNGQLPTRFHG
jgi:hypothetical protein